MECPECKSTHINKNGRKRGKQNYICVDCQRQFLDHYQIQRGYSDEFKRECLTLYVNGMGLRAIARVKGINHVSVINWVKQVGELLPDAYNPETTPQVGDHSAETFKPLWEIVSKWQCYFYVTDGWKVYPGFIPNGDQIVSKTYMTLG